MGLDMYLSKKTYVKNWDHQNESEKHQISVLKNGVQRSDIKPERITYIEEEVGYWRKANHIHQWFVDNIQDGNDDCQDYNVSEEKLKELKETCEEVLSSLENSKKTKATIKTGWNKDGDTFTDIDVFSDTKTAEELLPTQGGFFFGGTQYDEWYLESLKDTIEIINTIFSEIPEGQTYLNGDIYYQSSW